MQNRGLESQACLPYLLVTERDNPDKPQLSVAQRFELCLTTAAEVTALHGRGVIPECLGLHGIIVNATGGTIKVTLAGIKMPTNISWIAASGYALDDVIITTSDNSLSEKSSVQLLGLLFLKIFQPMLHGEHLQNYRSIDRTSEQKVLDLFGLMINPDPDLRPTLNQTIRSLQLISSTAMLVQYRPSAATIERYKQGMMRQRQLEALEAEREYAALPKRLTWRQEDDMRDYALSLMKEQAEASAASAAASVSASLTASCTLFSSTNVSCNDLIASQPLPDNSPQQGPKH